MAGKAGMKGEGLGGSRPGAGRPCKAVSIKPGDTFAVWTALPDGVLPGELWTVEAVSRSEIVITSSAGETYRLIH
jgi:hypothetical protein